LWYKNLKAMKTKNLKTGILILLVSLFSFTSSIADTWYKINLNTSKKINTICFSSPLIGYLGGNDSLLLKTTDGGVSWSKLNFSGLIFFPGGEHILKLQFINDNVGFMTVGPYSGSYQTLNGGATWTQLPLAGNHCYNQGLFFFDQNNGFIGGSGCFQSEIISQLSMGTWTTQTLSSGVFNPNHMITDITFANDSFGLAGSQSGYIYRTTNRGATWDSVPGSFDLNPITSVLIVNDSLAYAGYLALNVGYSLYKSTDGGLTWGNEVNTATFFYPDFLSLHKSGNSRIFSSAFSNPTSLIFYYPGSFGIWDYDLVDQKINAITSYSDSVVFAAGDSGYLVVNKNIIGLSIKSNVAKPNKFSIQPNPASDLISIKTSNGFINQIETIQIYTALGKLVYSRAFTEQIDVSSFEKGMYFVELSSGGLRHRVKMILN
jgi:photosystem II stability/assembly factor-like uncharacterized protein